MTKTSKELTREKMDSFEAVLSRYESALLRYAVRIVRDRDAAQEIVQESFIRLFKSWDDDFAPSTKLSTWLYRVTHNCAVDYLRCEARRQMLNLRQVEGEERFVAPDRGEGFAVSEDAELAMAALKTLSLREQQLVILKVFEEKSYEEIGQIAGLTTGNVGYILHHAMKKLAAELKKARAI